MNSHITNIYNSERSVECIFAKEAILKYLKQNSKILDVGGIPTHTPSYDVVMQGVQQIPNVEYQISDFRGGKYRGDFVTIHIPELYDCIMFISSLEHFPQCTEGDLVFRPNEDKKGFSKALSLLKDNGKIILTVPMGKQVWQNYHQNYNYAGILDLIKGSNIIESKIYTLSNDQTEWVETNKSDIDHILYTDKCYCVGCFVIEKI